MPLYEYTCPACGHEFEELTRPVDADRTKCPGCGAKAERKLSVFSASAAPDRSPASAAPPTCQGCRAEAGTCPYR